MKKGTKRLCLIAVRHAERDKTHPDVRKQQTLTTYGKICCKLMATRLRTLYTAPELRFTSTLERAVRTDREIFCPDWPDDHAFLPPKQLESLDDLSRTGGLKELKREVCGEQLSEGTRSAMLMGKGRALFLQWMQKGFNEILQIASAHARSTKYESLCVSVVVHEWWLDFLETICACSGKNQFFDGNDWPQDFRLATKLVRPCGYSEAVIVDLKFDSNWTWPIGVLNCRRHSLPNVVAGRGSHYMREVVMRFSDDAEDMDPKDQPFVDYNGSPDWHRRH